MDYINELINTLEIIDNNIQNNKNIALEDLKNLLLIIYNECLINESTNPLVKSYITICLHHFIELENFYANLTTEQEYNERIFKDIINKKLREDI